MPLDYTIHHRDARVRLPVTATRPPGRGRTWTVEAGHWRAEGATEKAAVDALTERLQVFLTHYQEPKVLSFRGHTAVIALDLGGERRPMAWSEQVIRPDGYTLYSSFAADCWAEAQARASFALAHASTDWHDDASVHEAAAYLAQQRPPADSPYGPHELYGYAAWQRAAAAAIADGREDWHQWAHQHQAGFAVPAPAPTAAS